MTTRASAIANRLRQIRDSSHPATKARVARRIYTLATVLYLGDHTSTAKFPDEYLLILGHTGPAAPAAEPRPTP